MQLKRICQQNLPVKIRQWLKQDYRVLFTACSVAACILILGLTGSIQFLELVAYDQLVRLRPEDKKDDRILIVAIDETDLKQAGSFPISDQLLAQLLYKLNEAKPLAIGLDIIRDFPVAPGHQEFNQALEQIPNLIGIETLNENPDLVLKAPKILEQKQQIGFNNLLIDPDGTIRRMITYRYDSGEAHTSFALQLALIYLNNKNIFPDYSNPKNPSQMQLGKATLHPFQPNDGAYINADAGGYQIFANFVSPYAFDLVSMTDVLQGKIDPSLIRERLVLIGITAPSVKDLFYLPYSRGFLSQNQRLSGVEIHANFISQILRAAISGRPLLQVWSDPIETIWIFVWSLLGSGLIWRWRSPLRASIGLIVAGTGLVAGTYASLLIGWWIPMVAPLLGLFGSAAIVTSYLAHQQQELKRSTEFLQSVIDKIPDPIFVKDQQYRWLILNEAFCQFLGYPAKELLGKTDYDFFTPTEANVFRFQDQLVLKSNQPKENEEQFTNVHGDIYLIATKRSLHQDAAGNTFLVGVIRDITERKRIEAELRRTAEELSRSNAELKRSENQLRYLANHDPLTGLANRKLFQESLQNLILWGQENQQLVGLLYLDLDGFKPVNDNLGHDIGDLLLKAVAQRIKNCLRASDVVSRLGGDEFTVILPGIKQVEDALIVSEKIINTISKPYMLNGHSINIRVSIGSSVYPEDGDTSEILIKKADVSMYAVKKSGKRQNKAED